MPITREKVLSELKFYCLSGLDVGLSFSKIAELAENYIAHLLLNERAEIKAICKILKNAECTKKNEIDSLFMEIKKSIIKEKNERLAGFEGALETARKQEANQQEQIFLSLCNSQISDCI